MENPLPNDPCAEAWAAGVFDGEGSVSGYIPRSRRTRAIQITVYQATPQLLERFRASVGGHGNIHGPYRGRLYHWTTKRRASVSAVCAALWPSLSFEKRRQFERAVHGHAQFEELVARLSAAEAMFLSRRTRATELAWAAGLFDGEGSITLRRSGSPTLEISQAADPAGLSSATEQFRSAVASLGYISGPRILSNPWSRLPQYRWQAASFEHAQAVLAMLWPWLGDVKRGQARSAFDEYLTRARQRRI